MYTVELDVPKVILYVVEELAPEPIATERVPEALALGPMAIDDGPVASAYPPIAIDDELVP